MPAASCRIMPARSISRCETISASFGFSLRMGRKNRDNRMGTPVESVGHGKPAVKPDRVRKHKGGDEDNPLSLRFSCRFTNDVKGADKALGVTKRRTGKKAPWSVFKQKPAPHLMRGGVQFPSRKLVKSGI